MITREMGTLSDEAARKEVVLPQPVCKILFPHLISALKDRRGGKFKVLCPHSCLIVSNPIPF